MKYPVFLFTSAIFLCFSCAKKAELKDYLYERPYAPPQELGFRIVSDSTFIGDSVEITIPGKYQTNAPHVGFLLKDTVTGVYDRLDGQVEIRDGKIRHGLDYKFENYDNLEIGRFWLWDSQFIVHSGGIMGKRFLYHWSEEEQVFKYIPTGTDADSYLILDLKKMLADGNGHLYPAYLKFAATYIETSGRVKAIDN